MVVVVVVVVVVVLLSSSRDSGVWIVKKGTVAVGRVPFFLLQQCLVGTVEGTKALSTSTVPRVPRVPWRVPSHEKIESCAMRKYYLCQKRYTWKFLLPIWYVGDKPPKINIIVILPTIFNTRHCLPELLKPRAVETQSCWNPELFFLPMISLSIMKFSSRCNIASHIIVTETLINTVMTSIITMYNIYYLTPKKDAMAIRLVLR